MLQFLITYGDTAREKVSPKSDSEPVKTNRLLGKLHYLNLHFKMFLTLTEEHPEGFQWELLRVQYHNSLKVILSSVNCIMYLEGLTPSYEYNLKCQYR